ncbi:hypothetical protein AVEN_78049-1 [Araneus ventricosus]|uniref:Uncharacterized protein n=1 Tax=Araneus ventricosus TaxID=182803 RepID=A0A4Y2RRZ5_ARAVE|nr:hypothetical protein AVEN_78049-1 [Araneus ventricosus]
MQKSDVRFVCPIRALQSYNGALMEYRMPICYRHPLKNVVYHRSVVTLAELRESITLHLRNITPDQSDHFYSMIRGSLTELRRKPNHDDVRWDFFLSVNVAREYSSECFTAIDDRTLWPFRLGDGRDSI